MSFLLWHRSGDTRLASTRRVLRAAEVPILQQANALRDTLERRRDQQIGDLAEALDEARARGHAEGLAAGRHEAGERLAEALQALAQGAAAEREQRRSETGALALQVVRKLLGHFADDAVLVALADAALAELLPAPALTLVVHPQQLDAVRRRLVTPDADGASRYELRADPGLAPDGCRIETEHGSVDVSLSTQLDRLAAAWGLGGGAAG